MVNEKSDPICTDKKHNVRYWDGLDALAEEFARELARSSFPPKKLNDDMALEVSKEILEVAIKQLEERGCHFPYVDENY